MIPSLFKKWPTGPGWKCGEKGHALETGHLLLRRPQPKDHDAIRNVFDEDVVDWLGLPNDDEPLDTVATEWGRSLQHRPYREQWLICDKSSKDVVGLRSIVADASDAAVCSTENAFAHEWRGRGLAKEELAAFIGVVPHLGFSVVHAYAQVENEKAIALYTKFGFIRTNKVDREMPNGYRGAFWDLELKLTSSKKHCELR